MARRDQRQQAVIALASLLVAAGLLVPSGAYIAARFQPTGTPAFEWWPNPLVLVSTGVIAVGLALFSSLILGWPIRSLDPDAHERAERIVAEERERKRNHLAQLSYGQLQAFLAAPPDTPDEFRSVAHERITLVGDWIENNYTTAERAVFDDLSNLGTVLSGKDGSRAYISAEVQCRIGNVARLVESLR